MLITTWPYFLGVISSVIIILFPIDNMIIQNSSILPTFMSLSPISLLKIILGLFILGFFPGYAIYDRFLRNTFSGIEKIGLIIATSYCVNSIIGLLLLAFNFLSIMAYLGLLWIFVGLVLFSGKIMKYDGVEDTPFLKFSLSWNHLLMIITSVILLFGSYSLTLTSGPISGLFAGDISKYMVFTNELFHLGIPSYIPWLSSYMVVGSVLTGLPMIYVYSVIQYLVLLIPFSIYFLLKIFFPQQQKLPSIGAFMVSLLYGLSSIPFIAKLVATPSLFTNFFSGGVQSTLTGSFSNIFFANTQSYVLWNRTIEYGLCFFALAFLFRYLRVSGERNRLFGFFLGALFLVAAVFSRSIFLVIPILLTFVVFSLFELSYRKKIFKIIVVFVLFFSLLLSISNTYLMGQIITPLLYSFFSIVNSSVGFNTVLLLGVLSISLLVLIFRDKLPYRFKFHKVSFSHNSKTLDSGSSIYLRWIIGVFVLFTSLVLCFLNYDGLNHITMGSSRPWYVWIAYFGIQLVLLVVYLPNIYNKFDNKSLKFLSIFTLSVFVMYFFSLIPIETPFFGAYGTFYLFLMAYPLTWFVALSLDFAFSNQRKIILNPQSLLRHSVKSKNKLFYVITTFLVMTMALSFLSYTYSVAMGYPQDKYSPRLSSSETDVLEWAYSSLPKNSVVITLSESSYRKVTSILPNKILPIFLEINSSGEKTWSRDAIIESRLPEVILSNLYQLGATHVFIGTSDYQQVTKSNSTFINLLQLFPVVSNSENVKLYEIPRILYEDANYHVVSGYDYPETKIAISFEQDVSPIIISDEDQSSFWTAHAIREGKGSLGTPVLYDDTSFSFNGANSLKIKTTNGNYGAWQIYHKYDSLQDWSSQDYIAFYWYGGNTGATLSLQIESEIANNDYYVYKFTDNWSGWKRLIAVINKPDSESPIKPDLSRIDQITIGFWYSENVHGTFWLDRVTVDVGKFTDKPSSITCNQLVSEMLLTNDVPYSILPEDTLTTLFPNDVYIFPYNKHISKDTIANLLVSVSNGAHIIFTNPLFASSSETESTSQTLPEILNYELFLGSFGVTNRILFDNRVVNCSFNINHRIHFNDDSKIDVLASCTLSNTDSIIPYIMKQAVGRGSITFIDLSLLTDLPLDSRVEILDVSLNYLSNYLSTPSSVDCLQKLPIPSQIFADIAFRGSTYDFWLNSNLLGKMTFYNGVTVKENFSIVSDYLDVSCTQLDVNNMKIFTDNGVSIVITDTKLYDVKIFGQGILSFNSANAELLNYPTGFYTKLNVNSDSIESLNSAEFSNMTFTFKKSPDGESEIYSGDATISFSLVNTLIVWAKQPQLILEGSLEGNIYGAFIHNKYYFYSRAQQKNIKGDFTLDILYSSGITYAEIRDIQNVEENIISP